MSNERTTGPHPNYKDFDEFVGFYCQSFANLVGRVSPEYVRQHLCDLAELRKSYEGGEMHGDVAWSEFESGF